MVWLDYGAGINTERSFVFYDLMWSTFNALFVVYPMGHFTVGWIGKGTVLLYRCTN